MTKDTPLAIIDKIDGRLQEMIDGISSLANEYGPGAVDLTMDTVRLAGFGPLAIGFFCLFLAIFSIKYVVHFGKLASEARYGKEGPPAFMVVVCGATAFVCVASQPFTTLYFWNYVAAFYPEAYLAHKVLGL